MPTGTTSYAYNSDILSMKEVEANIGNERNFILKKGRGTIKTAEPIDLEAFYNNYVMLKDTMQQCDEYVSDEFYYSEAELKKAEESGSERFKSIGEEKFLNDYYLVNDSMNSVYYDENDELVEIVCEKVSAYNEQLNVLRKALLLLEMEDAVNEFNNMYANKVEQVSSKNTFYNYSQQTGTFPYESEGNDPHYKYTMTRKYLSQQVNYQEVTTINYSETITRKGPSIEKKEWTGGEEIDSTMAYYAQEFNAVGMEWSIKENGDLSITSWSSESIPVSYDPKDHDLSDTAFVAAP